MEVFKLQDERKMQSGVLLLLFVTVLLVMAVVFHVVSVVINFPVSGEMDFSNPQVAAVGFILLLWIISLMGCYFRIIDVREGGAAVAHGLGAVEANPASRDGDEQLLIDVVSEIAVASACEVPRVFILHREYAINAFVVGGFSGKEALVVSKGALYDLDRDELAAVVAHEFGHISQGDIPLNMYLMVALGGLNAIDEVGKILMVKGHRGYILQPGLFVGFVIRIIGSIGVFCGRVVRSAFTRQREYLADACAVQFTRSPFHLAAALRAVHDANEDQSIHSVRAEEIAHLCFQGGSVAKWYDRIFSSHPPLKKRIDEICPHFDIKVRQRQRAEKRIQG